MRKRVLFVLVGLWIACPAWAPFHFMKIVEVFPGTAASPAAQYVVLQAYSSGQNFVGGHSIVVYDASGGVVGSSTFPTDVSNGADQAKILIGTAEAEALFSIAADLIMSSSIDPTGGKACFDTIDCVAWGNYTGPSGGVGTPVGPGGLVLGQAIRRNLGSDGLLQDADDTDDSATDFAFVGVPAPTNNSGDGCGDGITLGLEECDDGNGFDDDACVAFCVSATCGDGFTRTGVEECDDGNGSNGDACVQDCFLATCGDTFTQLGVEECDDGNDFDDDACVRGCLNATCGDGFTRTGIEECDDGNDFDIDACVAGCLNATCGDTFIQLGVEECDDGDVIPGDGCSATCTFETTPQEAGAGGTLRVTRGAGTALAVSFAPACGATDHGAYWGAGPVADSGPAWTGSACGLGTSGGGTFDPGATPPSGWLYLVIVGHDAVNEGSYGVESRGTERPESVAVGACDRPQFLGGDCP